MRRSMTMRYRLLRLENRCSSLLSTQSQISEQWESLFPTSLPLNSTKTVECGVPITSEDQKVVNPLQKLIGSRRRKTRLDEALISRQSLVKNLSLSARQLIAALPSGSVIHITIQTSDPCLSPTQDTLSSTETSTVLTFR